MNNYILVIGASTDVQFICVVDKLRARKAPFIFLDFCDRSCNFSCSFDDPKSFVLTYNGRKFGAPDVLWCRLKLDTVIYAINREHRGEFLRRSEWSGFANGLEALFSNKSISVNSRSGVNSKIYQRSLAQAAGFQLLPTDINFGRRSVAASIAAKSPGAVVKPIALSRLAHPTQSDVVDMLYTRAVTVSDVEVASDLSLSANPLLIQQAVLDAPEYRVIAIAGGHVFPYQVHYGVDRGSIIDSRALVPTYKYEQPQVNLIEITMHYLEASKAAYGVFDLFRRDNRWVFLECNHEGQWHSANNINLDKVAEALSEHIMDRFHYVDRHAGSTLDRN